MTIPGPEFRHPLNKLALFIIDNPRRVVEQCLTGVRGFLPGLNARRVCGGMVGMKKSMANTPLACCS